MANCSFLCILARAKVISFHTRTKSSRKPVTTVTVNVVIIAGGFVDSTAATASSYIAVH